MLLPLLVFPRSRRLLRETAASAVRDFGAGASDRLRASLGSDATFGERVILGYMLFHADRLLRRRAATGPGHFAG
jgi:hypothetical protein